uniref:Uncharacterized protein n=1 Tax=Arundo donax TaxID=35708 RepID=A0A0A8Z969_ARUDO
MLQKSAGKSTKL